MTKPVAQRPGGRTARVRAQILDATARLVARDGIAGFRYEEVAELAGAHKMTVYRNWPDRNSLVSEALLAAAEHTATLSDTGDLRQDLVDFLLALAAGMADPTGRALVLAIQSAKDNPDLRATTNTVLAHRVALVQHRVDHAVALGEIPQVDALLLADLLSGPVQLHVSRDLRPFTREDAERIVDVVLAGLRATAR
ncbi:TetR/AcrR family transcriptional regulator C-terminal ligand-binding domain-containing protein [Umezawaea endophytica]|uniref:TetR/AcrR family transcriptional regulator n=1 Tax=Umezawaea endophytica TaxID=1654476 RepID=A0A9X2VEN5_9PSEU|nr:TetR/AcrR family transcriptional regulator [Umezawaea endophytica]MCS7475241.1 TetR/AcrR family transcriptional regulator [Umezawaea endophytica]